MSQSSDPSPKPKLRIREASAPSKPEASSHSKKGRSTRHKSSGLENAAKILLGISAVAAPWYFGSVSAIAQFVIASAFLLCLVIWLIASIIGKKERSSVHSSALLVLLFIVIGFLQQADIPSGLGRQISSKQMEIRATVAQEFETSHPELADALKSSTKIALNHPAARYQHAYFVLVATGILLGSRFFYRRTDVLWLAAGLAFNGAVLTIFGAFQKVLGSKSIYGSVLEFGGQPFASFVNRNNAAGYLLICLGCGIAVLIYSFSNLKTNESAVKNIGPGREGTFQNLMKEIGALLANLNVWRIVLLVTCGILVSGVAMSLSRGGMISLVVSIFLLLLFLFRNQKNRALILVALFLVPIGAVSFGWAAMQDSVIERLETLSDQDQMSAETRIQFWKDTIHAVADYPVLGSGVGSFPYVYKEYQTTKDQAWFFHAENTFLELLVTFGIVGFLILSSLIGVWFIAAIALPKPISESRKAVPKTAVIGILGFFLLISQGVSNFFDFGFLIPSNGIAFGLLMGALVGVYSTHQVSQNPNQPRLSILPRWTKWPLVTVLILICGNSLLIFLKESKTEAAILSSRTKSLEELTLAQVTERIERLEKIAFEGSPNLETYEFLGVLYQLRFQHEFVEHQLKNPASDHSHSRQLVWNMSSIRILNFVFSNYEVPDLPGRELDLETLKTRDFYQNIELAEASYEKALEISPLSLKSIVGLAELSHFTGHDVSNYFTVFSRLNARHAPWFRRMGEVAIAHNDPEQAIRFWQKALEIDDQEFKIIVPTALVFLGTQTTCEKVLPSNPKILLEIAKNYFVGEKFETQEARDLVMQKIIEVLSDKAFTDAESNYLLGYAYKESGDITQAISSYEAAIAINPLKTEWKYELSLIYSDVGNKKKALALVEQCLADDPTNDAYMKRKESLIEK